MSTRVVKKARDWLREELHEMLSKGIIEPADPLAEWTSPIVVATKPGGGFRLCVDYRELNKATNSETYPQRNTEEVLLDIAIFGSQKSMLKVAIGKFRKN
eukprot:GHVP01022637.1.p1 GENE.GHVP01022637.1~~GHVP01022637.1.p1  ORF type:complete len:100 (+),score=10.96 GHVP01022637.1:1615-1914(+)